MLTIKHTALLHCPDAIQILALVDALTNIKTGRSVGEIVDQAFKGAVVAGMTWRKHKFSLSNETYLFYIKGEYYIAIKDNYYISHAMYIAETAYLQLCEQTEHKFDPNDAPLWEYNYINENVLSVANTVLKAFGDEQTKQIKTEVLEVMMGSVKRIYPHNETNISHFACLKVKFIK